MGYKKLDEVMELLNDELDGFNKSVDRMERLTKNVQSINVKPDTREIKSLLNEHLKYEKANNQRNQETLRNIEEKILKARLVPKVQLWLQYSILIILLVIIGYLTFRISKIDNMKEDAFIEGRQEVLFSLKGYFDRYPEHYNIYQEWTKEKDSVPNHK